MQHQLREQRLGTRSLLETASMKRDDLEEKRRLQDDNFFQSYPIDINSYSV
jgi:hypothetical protein